MSDGVTFIWPVMVFSVLVTGPWLFAFIDAMSRPLADWTRAGHHKLLWVAGIVFVPVVAAVGVPDRRQTRPTSRVART